MLIFKFCCDKINLIDFYNEFGSVKVDSKFKHTTYASYLGYITQAISINLASLFFVIFQRNYNISFSQISLIVTINFIGQMLIDISSTKIIPALGVRKSVVLAHVSAAAGLVLLGILPNIMKNAYVAILIATIFMSIGGGLTEVLISPIVDSIPGEGKAMRMSLLHSFYSWGYVIVIIGTTLFFKSFGQQNWAYISIIWAIVPILNSFYFGFVPLPKSIEEEEKADLKKLFGAKLFLAFMFLMVCSGASEQAMSQWASLFAEEGLGVSKEVGDILGPCMFALLMGLSRVIYAVFGSKINLKNALTLSSALCVLSYLLTVFSKNAIVSLGACAFCGMTVGLMWPGILSLSSQYNSENGSAMFAFLALAGDVGCTLGPLFVGSVSDFAKTFYNGKNFLISASGASEFALKLGMLAAIVFPAAMVIRLLFLKKSDKTE